MTTINCDVNKSDLAIEPIKSLKLIAEIKKNIAESPRDLAIFSIGTSSNISITDLINIKISQVENLLYGKSLTIASETTSKTKQLNLVKESIDAIDQLLFSLIPFKGDEFLFRSDKNEQLSVFDIDELVKKWCRDISLEGNFSSLTLIKTWGYIQKTVYDVNLETVGLGLHLNSADLTRDYLHI
jgi:site-specific recombinase XerC